jgi:N-acetylglucosamine malate deacetylase 1
MASRTLLVGLAHPDDEVGAAGTIAAQRAAGDHVVIVWLTRGEKTEAFGPVPEAEVAARRTQQGEEAARILDAEVRFLDLPDTRLSATPEAASEVAAVIAEVRPDALLTWGGAWTRGMRHPDHQAAGKIFRDAVTLARIAKHVTPRDPHRAAVPVFTFRDVHSQLPAAAVDVEPYLETIDTLGRFYQERIGFGDPEWLRQRLRDVGDRWGVGYAEEWDAWETEGELVPDLLASRPLDALIRPPDRTGPVGS